MESKKCINSECCADNPVNAKFCRKCGTAFTPADRYKQMISSAISKVFIKCSKINAESFTLDTFRNITFQPVSVVKIRFVNRFVLFLCLLFAALWFATITGLTGEILSEIDRWFYEELFIYHQYIVELGCLVIAGLCTLFIVKWWIKKLQYKLNADYIESNFVNDGIMRIARKSRMGLFDKNKTKVLLSSNYSNIEKFDDEHLILSVGTKKGLYSLKYRRIIVPIKYESISKFMSSVTTARFNGNDYHYDVKGNLLR
ncbi:zinc ribbon domain-containing protein [Bacteroides thetaiotaomicron]|uniref:zinc ribbon domain-containing protein n=1 Tax=Bacteroides thetaiotaomicron TaxID=818 RepID=UPI00232D58F2|nr:zinc ribbon domain-containing protein [Bacteroides thetaiotaomicron]MDC2009061.1 zinc ribbon domain-containing protein [Bacteroides thetaiotaomicron]MDC2023221.1 zinc ribbon domain-containing protein [Bacteroides thetaiotaomicron]MDC2025805.1 zinc ribbon domain-containing protein [Bacteroides thetaiotaomicron]MDC2032315.1 zinc ribbon domain-containing protein [Bacteroides thetaiotaomicron]MDC2063278.1 zinc ribbon domain-containing protein [Bacteroides thetaiotaomicron]